MKAIILLVIFISYSINSFPQLTDPINSTASKYNKRGIFNNGDLSSGGTETVSDYDGNLMINYSTHLALPNDLSSDFTVILNNNVQHRAIRQCTAVRSGFMFNVPEWILGYKGIALQTLNFETLAHIATVSGYLTRGELVPMLIPGYHYSNSLQHNYDGFSKPDYIQILLADGSLKTLQNTNTGPTTGIYVEKGTSTSTGFAMVQNYYLPGAYTQHFRQVWYKPGDGLTYFFEEEPVRYGAINSENFELPKALYLKQVFDQTGSNVTFEYGYISTYTEKYGRKVLLNIKSNRRTSNPNGELTLDYGNPNYLNSIIINNYNSDDYLKLYITNPSATLFGSIMSPDSSRILYVTKIEDKLGKYDLFTYSPFTDNIVNRIFSYGSSGNTTISCAGYLVDVAFTMNYNFYLLKQVDYYSGRRTVFTYYNDFLNSSVKTSVELANEFQGLMPNFDLSFRDSFTNFMLQNKDTFNKYSQDSNNALLLSKTESYIYSRNGSGGQFSPKVDNILTTITTTNHITGDNSSPSSVTDIKNYSKISHSDVYYGLADISSTIKLITETKDGGSEGKVVINNYPNLGNYIDNSSPKDSYYDGTFDTDSTLVLKYNAGSTNHITYKTWFSHSYTNLDFKRQSDNVLLLRRYLRNNDITFDPKTLNNYTLYKNFYESPIYDTNTNTALFYKTSLTQEKRQYTGQFGTTPKNDTYYSYYDATEYNGEFLGKLKEVKEFYNMAPLTRNTLFSYYTSSENYFYRGFLKSKTDPSGATDIYTYPYYNGSSISDAATGIYYDYQGNSYTQNIGKFNYQLLPFRTQKNFVRNPEGVNTNHTYYFTTGLEKPTPLPTGWPNGYINKSSNDVYYRDGGAAAIFQSDTLNSSNKNNDQTLLQPAPQSESGDYLSFINNNGYVNPADYISVTNATLNVRVNCTYRAPAGSQMKFKVYALTSPYVYGQSTYYYMGTGVDVTLSSYQTTIDLGINVLSLLQELVIVQKKNVYGFVFVASPYNQTELDFVFTTITTIPNTKPLLSVNGLQAVSNISYNYYSSFNAKGLIEYQTDYNQYFSKYIYDNLGRLNYLSLPGSFTSSIGSTNYSAIQSFNDISKIINIQNRFKNIPGSETNLETQIGYDALGQERNIAVKNSSSTFETKAALKYNYLGLVRQVTDGMGRNKKYNYDYLGRVIKITFDDNYYQAFQYFPETGIIGNQTYYERDLFTDENGKTKETFYDLAGNKIAERAGDISGLLTQFYYDSFYRITSTKTPMSKITSYQYDNYNNVTQKISPDEGTYNYKYDQLGNLRFTFHTTATSAEVVFTEYDQLNRVFSTGKISGDINFFNSLNPNIFYQFQADTSKKVVLNLFDEYDRSGLFSVLPSLTSTQITAMNVKGNLVATAFRDKPGNTWNYKYFSYDPKGNVNGEWIKFGINNWKSITNSYDKLNNLTYQIANNDMYYWYNYDIQSRLSTVQTNKTNSQTGAVSEISYTYNSADQQTLDSYPSMLANSVSLGYNYNNRGWLSNITRNGAGFSYYETLTYYANGNVNTQALINSGLNSYNSYAYLYDNYNRLTQFKYSIGATIESFSYNNDGNISYRYVNGVKSYYYNFAAGTNKLSNVYNGTITGYYTYDNKGNVTADGLKSISGITYDHRNLPLNMTGGSGTYYYRYDDGGNRIYKQDLSTKEFYLRDYTGKELAVYDMNTNKIKLANIYGNDGMIGRIDVSWNGSIRTDTRYYYLKDHLGSTRVEFDRNASVSSAYGYYAYGQISQSYNNSNPNDKYKFTGKERDTETNYDYFGARYYDSELGRFLSCDKYSYKYPSLSSYQYGGNNPIRYIDINGDSLWVGVDRNAAINIIQQIANIDVSSIYVSDDGLVGINIEGQDLANNEGLSVLNDIIGSDKNILFSVSSEYTAKVSKGGNIKHFNLDLPLVKGANQILGYNNLSITSRDNVNAYLMPADKKFAGAVYISSNIQINKNNSTLPSASLAFHELAENYARSILNKNYQDAHQYSLGRENIWERQTNRAIPVLHGYADSITRK